MSAVLWRMLPYAGQDRRRCQQNDPRSSEAKRQFRGHGPVDQNPVLFRMKDFGKRAARATTVERALFSAGRTSHEYL